MMNSIVCPLLFHLEFLWEFFPIGILSQILIGFFPIGIPIENFCKGYFVCPKFQVPV